MPDTRTSDRMSPEAKDRHAPRGLRGLPLAVWAAVAFFAATMTFWTIADPTYRSADEPDHVSAAIYWETYHSWPGFKEMPRMASVDASVKISGIRSTTKPVEQRPALSAADATPRPDRPSFSELGSGTDTLIDKAGQHPPGYSVLLGTVADVLPDSIPWDLEVWVFRMISVLLLTPLPLAAALVARRLGANRVVISAAALSVLAVPQLAVVGGAVNNDNLLNAAGAWIALGTVHVLTGDLRRRTALWVGLVSAVALLTKAWSLPLVAVVVLAYLVAAVRGRTLRRVVAPALVFVVAAMAGGWWWIHNVVVYGKVQPAGHFDALATGPLARGDTLQLMADQFEKVFPSRFWALLSVKSGAHAYPAWIPEVLTVALVLLLLAGLILSPRIGVKRGTVVVLLLPTALTLAILVESVYSLTQKTGVAAGVQGRYLYSSIVPLLVVAVIGLAALLGLVSRRRAARVDGFDVVGSDVVGSVAVGAGRFAAVLVGLFAILFTVASVGRAISFHFGDEHWSNPLLSLGDVAAWSPLPYALSIAVMIAFGVAALLALVASALSVRATPGRAALVPDNA